MRRFLFLVCAVLVAPAAVHAQALGGDGEWGLRGGMGFSSGPDTFLLSVGLPYRVGPAISVGPQVQLGLADNRTLVAATVDARLYLGGRGRDAVHRIQPYMQAGLGLAYIERDRRAGDRDDLGFLASGGVGFDYALNQRLALGSNFSLNLLPSRVLGERFFFTWQVITARIRF